MSGLCPVREVILPPGDNFSPKEEAFEMQRESSIDKICRFVSSFIPGLVSLRSPRPHVFV